MAIKVDVRDETRNDNTLEVTYGVDEDFINFEKNSPWLSLNDNGQVFCVNFNDIDKLIEALKKVKIFQAGLL